MTPPETLFTIPQTAFIIDSEPWPVFGLLEAFDSISCSRPEDSISTYDHRRKQERAMLVTEMLERARSLYGNKVGIICGEERFTYSQFGRRVDRLARALVASRLEKGDRVAILHRNCHHYLEAYFAVLRAGLVLCPLNYRLSPRELAAIIEDNQAKVLVAEGCFTNKVGRIRAGSGLSPLVEVIWTGGEVPHDLSGVRYEDFCDFRDPSPEAVDDAQDLVGSKSSRSSGSEVCGDGYPAATAAPEDMINLYYTSGTTGRQKGVMLSHRNVYCHALSTIAELHLTDGDVWIHAAPMFHLADAWATWAITWVGGTHTFVREFDPLVVLRTMERERVTITNMIPMMLNALVNCEGVEKFDLSSLRAILSGGAPIAPKVVRKIMDTFKCDYIQTYGLTETSPYLTMSILKDSLKELPSNERFDYKASTGRPVLGISLKVVTEQGREVRRDRKEVGEIIVKGDAVTGGYWRLPEETSGCIRDGWLSTGDLAVIDEEGYVNIVDRRKDMIVTGGENVYSTEVENVLYMHPAVLEAAVVAVPDEIWGEAVKAVVVLKDTCRSKPQTTIRGIPGDTTTPGAPGEAPGSEGEDHASATADDIITFCKQHIAGYKVPRSVDFVDKLPKTGSGKIYKKDLRDKYWKGCDRRIS